MSKALVTTDENEFTIKDAEFCIKSENDFVDTKYHNICTGEVYIKPTGIYDYMVGIPGIICVLVFTVLIITILIKFITD